jgi:hypothetical protein
VCTDIGYLSVRKEEDGQRILREFEENFKKSAKARDVKECCSF